MLFLDSFVNIKDGGEEKIVYVKEDKFVAILRGNVEEAELTSFLYSILDELNEEISLSEFDELIATKIKEKNLPPTLDLACGFLKNGKLYLKTINKGEIFGKRGKESAKIIQGNKSAVGYVKNGDIYIFTFEGFKEDFLKDLSKEKFHLSTEEIEEFNHPFVGSFIEELEREEKTFMPSEFSQPEISIPQFLSRKSLQYILAFLILLALGLSVYSGYKKRQEKIWNERKAQVSKKIEEFIAKAEDEAYFSPGKAKEYFSEAEKQFQEFKGALPKGRQDLAKDLEEKLNKKRQEIFKESIKDLEEVFDLNLIDKNLEGKYLAFSDSTVYILTRNNRVVFVDLDTKKSGKINTEKVENITLLASFEGKGYAFSDKGIFEIKEEREPDLLVDSSEKWREIIDFEVYGKNFYLLDLDNKQVLKHTPVESGYSDAIEYLESPLPSLFSSSNMAIDGSIYIVSNDKVYKYYQGKRQDFSVKLPVENYNFDFIYTDKDLDFLYLLDKKSSKVYIVNKESGNFEEQVSNKIFSRASGFFVYKRNIYVLVDDKIYSLR